MSKWGKVGLVAIGLTGLFGVYAKAIGFSNEKKATKALIEMGYKDIKHKGHPVFGRNGELFADRFEATPPGAAKPVKIVVTSGLFKGNTIRVK